MLGFRNYPILLFLLFTLSTNAQHALSSENWQSDLDYFQSKIHDEYPNLFLSVHAEQFDSAISVLHNRIPNLTQDEIIVEFIRLTAMFRIGHTGVHFRIGENEEDLKPLFHYYPITLYPFSDGLFIKSIHKKYAKALGGRVIKICSMDIDIALKKLHEVIPCENEQYFKSNLQFYFRLPEILKSLRITPNSNVVTLTFIKGGVQSSIEITAEESPEEFWNSERMLPANWVDAYSLFDTKSSVLWLKEPSKIRYFEYLKENKTVYVRHSAVEDEPEETIAEYLKKIFDFVEKNDVEKFVLDIRLNAGGNNYLNKSLITGIIEQRKINRYGHLFVIIGGTTFSAAQNLTNELEKYTEAVFVGEPTGENVNFYGDVKKEILPNSKLIVQLSWLWWQNMDPRDKRPWTAPELAVGMSFENYKSGYDSAMNIITHFKDQKRIEHKIEELVLNGNVDGAILAGNEYLTNSLHRYSKYQLEEKLTDTGLLLAMRGKMIEGSKFFLVNTILFPASANSYNLYAECSYRLDQKEEAIKYFKLAIDKDPNGPIGESSKKTLTQLIEGK